MSFENPESHVRKFFPQQEKIRPFVLIALPVIMVVLGWYNVITQSIALEQATIRTYQDAELEVVKNAARAASIYIEGELTRRGTTAEVISQVEIEVLQLFVEPIQIGSVGDAWIYSPDYIVYDPSPDFPAEYIGKNMKEIFEIQSKSKGAWNYEDMANAVIVGQGGIGWYVWEPGKAKESTPWWEFLTKDAGREVAAWTPVQVFPGTSSELIWVIGMSSMLPEIMTSNGSYAQVQTNVVQVSLITVAVVILLFLLLRAETRVQKLEAKVAELKIEINESRKAEEVREVVESEYFQNLSARVKELRGSRQRDREASSEGDANS